MYLFVFLTKRKGSLNNTNILWVLLISVRLEFNYKAEKNENKTEYFALLKLPLYINIFFTALNNEHHQMYFSPKEPECLTP